MKHVNLIFALSIVFLLTACAQQDPIEKSSHVDRISNKSGEEANSFFKELSDKVKELQNEEASPLTERLTKDDGTNAFDDVIKEIQQHDEESGGQVSSMIDMILGAANEELGVDMTDMMKENLDNTNDLFNQFDEVSKTFDELVPKETAENLFEGYQDFIKTGGENGGIEKWLQEFVNYQKKTNPESANTVWMKKMEGILNNSEKSLQKETEQLLKEIMAKNHHLLDQYGG